MESCVSRPSRALGIALAVAVISIVVSDMQTAIATPRAADVEDGLRIEDYFRLKRIKELALSSDGKWLAYVMSEDRSHPSYQGSDSPKRQLQTVFTLSIDGAAKPVSPPELQDARAIEWIPGRSELAFVSSRSGDSQVFSYNPETGVVRQRTYASTSVEAYRYAPDGRRLAYVTRKIHEPYTTLYEQMFRGDRGVIADTDVLSIYHFVNPNFSIEIPSAPLLLWVQRDDGPGTQVPIPGSVREGSRSFFWSSGSDALSVTYVAASVSDTVARLTLTSLGVYELHSEKFRTIGLAREALEGQPSMSYSGGEWIPHEKRLLLRRQMTSNLVLDGSLEWAIVDSAEGPSRHDVSWRSIETYSAVFAPVNARHVMFENTMRGTRTLLELSADGRMAPRFPVADSSRSMFRFSADFSTFAFVEESLSTPPEIYLQSRSARVRQLTNLNEELTRRVRYTWREIAWKSKNGVRIQGWLLIPPNNVGSRPWPLITHVHGGPGSPYTNAFAEYFDGWPYPFELLAQRGVAVFFPNYRGTLTYGRDVAIPSHWDEEPATDVITGIEHLIETGMADPMRLGLAGHSFGAWVGPLVMSRDRRFIVGSFAEGSPNQLMTYLMMPDFLNKGLHVPTIGRGSSLHQDARLYVQASPDLHFVGLRTATLWEAGVHSLATLSIPGAKATRKAGAPTEFIVYPQTFHNPHLASIQRESAERNLEWFAFWLRGEEIHGDTKSEQYVRWRSLRASQRVAQKRDGGVALDQ